MNGIDWFTAILATIALALFVIGFGILTNRSLEIGALFGIYPIMWGAGVGLLALVLFALQHISLGLV